MKRFIFIITIIILSLSVSSVSATADSSSSIIQVNTRVLPYVKHNLLHQENNFLISSSDIERGYVDVNRALVLTIKTNSTNGYIINIFLNDPGFIGLSVTDAGATYKLSSSGGELYMPYQGKKLITKELGLRIHLQPNATPGVYQLPLGLMVTTV